MANHKKKHYAKKKRERLVPEFDMASIISQSYAHIYQFKSCSKNIFRSFFCQMSIGEK